MTDHRITLADLVADPARAMELSASEATMLLAQAGAVEAVLRARLALTNRPPDADHARPTEKGDRMLTIAEAAERARKSPRWIREHWRTEMPFARKVGRTILFPQQALDRWLKRI